jgi:hypothetical protein
VQFAAICCWNCLSYDGVRPSGADLYLRLECCFKRSSCTSMLISLRTSFCSDLYWAPRPWRPQELLCPLWCPPVHSVCYLSRDFNLLNISSYISFLNELRVVFPRCHDMSAPYCVPPALVFYRKIRANLFRGVSDRCLTHLYTAPGLDV